MSSFHGLVEVLQPIAMSGNPKLSMKLWIDDLDVKFLDQSQVKRDSTEVVFLSLFKDNFSKYERAFFPGRGGWLRGMEMTAGDDKGQKVNREEMALEASGATEKAAAEKKKVGSVIDDEEYASSSRSFKLENDGDEAGLAVKRYSMPARMPFCVSADNFSITQSDSEARAETAYAEISGRDRAKEKDNKRERRADDISASPGRRLPQTARRHVGAKAAVNPMRNGASKEEEPSKLLSGFPVSGTFYIYSFDGRLLAEYDISGAWVRDYIYFGGKLVAEYRTLAPHFYYYTSDQINSTRIVTDSSGTVVYSAAHDPYGGIQKTWITTYDPSLKFSGKERDAESGLDYFGARYYDRAQYRFISADPVIMAGAAICDPQRWNLYAYCGNNPLVYVDSTGLYKKPVHYDLTYDLAIQAHYTPAEAHIIASANNDVDSGFLSSFHPRPSFQESMESNYLHFPDSAQLASARMGAMNASNLAELAFYLHTIQDSYSHSGSIPVTIFTPAGPITIQVPVNKFTHPLLSIMAAMGRCGDPDDPNTNPSNYAKMRSETFYALLFWRANHIRFPNDVIFQIPCY